MIAKKIVLASLSAVLIAGAAIPAFAAPGPDGPRHHEGRRGGPDGGPHGGPRGAMMQDLMFVRLLKQADTNKDGKISKEELTARQEALFTEIDLNKDGTITRGEIVDFRDNKMAEFRKNNPPPTPEEAEDEGPDADGPMAEGPEGEGPKAEAPKADGPRADREQARDRHHDRHERREARRDRGPRGGPDGGMMGPAMFRMIDENRDRKISKEEAAAATEKLFARMDTNKDGQITIDDLPDRPL